MPITGSGTPPYALSSGGGGGPGGGTSVAGCAAAPASPIAAEGLSMLSVSQLACDACGIVTGGAVAAMPAVESKISAAATAADAILDAKRRIRNPPCQAITTPTRPPERCLSAADLARPTV